VNGRFESAPGRRSDLMAIAVGIVLIATALVACSKTAQVQDVPSKPESAPPAAATVAGPAIEREKPAPSVDHGRAGYDPANSTASVSGSVKFAGPRPEQVEVVMDSDPFCKAGSAGAKEWNERYVVNADGTLPNAFVWIALVPAQQTTGYPEPAAVTLDQKGCRFAPRVFGVRAGQDLTIRNSDQTLHNVHVRSMNNGDSNKGQAAGGVDSLRFSAAETAIPIQCDVHSWMRAYAFVLDHPFFSATDANGKFRIAGLPAGSYRIKAWHETVTGDGRAVLVAEADVTVADGEAKTMDLEVSAK